MIAVLLVLAFLIGSIPTGFIIAWAKGVDLRKVGSGNIGATNVLRAIGKEAAFITLICDILKGIVSVLIPKLLSTHPSIQMPEFHFGPLQVFINDPFTALQGILGIMAILGHNFSIFLRFKGGKGVATSLGVVIALSPNIGLITATIWLLSFRRTGYSSLSSLISFGMLPLCIYGFDYSYEKFLTAIFIAALIFVRHVSNIKRLLAGTENKFLREKK